MFVFEPWAGVESLTEPTGNWVHVMKGCRAPARTNLLVRHFEAIDFERDGHRGPVDHVAAPGP